MEQDRNRPRPAKSTPDPGGRPGPVRLQLLGPLRAWRGGEELDLGGLKQRAVLAVLATAAATGGRPVSQTELVDTLWVQDPPASAPNVVQTYLKRLRRLLEPERPPRAPSRLLRRTPAGYALDSSAVDIDLVRFRRLVGQATEALRGGEPEPAATRLATALRLWNGPPLDNTALPADHPRVVGLAGERWAAVARYGETMLELGQAAEALPVLEEAVAANPLDEAAQARLIRAYQAVGQRGRAFSAYHLVRRQLADELGVDPGPVLAAAHAALLAEDRDRAGEPAPGTRPGADEGGCDDAPAGPAPAQLPAATPAFAGRIHQLRQLDKLLAGHERAPAVAIAGIVGPAGIGKTTLALHWAHQAADRFPDGQLYVDLRGFDPIGSGLSPHSALRGFLEALRIPPEQMPATEQAQAGLYRSLLAGRRMLIVLDNARHAAQVRPLLPGASGCLVVVTSRDPLTGLVATDGAVPVRLELLSPGDAAELLGRRLGADRVAAEPDAVREIIDRCAGLPLALAVVAAHAATRPERGLAGVARQLREAGAGLDAFAGGDPASDVRAVFSWSYRTLPEAAARLFRLLGVHPGPELSVAAAASLAGLPVARVRPLLGLLARAQLIGEVAADRYGVHDLLRAYAAELVAAEPERALALRRVLDHYAHTASVAATVLEPSRAPVTPQPPLPEVTVERMADPEPARLWLETEHAALLAAVAAALPAGLDHHTWQLAWSLAVHLDWRGCWHDNVTVQAAGLAAATRLDDPAIRARAHQNLACAQGRVEQFEAATGNFHAALALFAQLGEALGQGFAHHNLAVMFGQQRRHQEALAAEQKALAHYRQAGYRTGEARILNAMAWSITRLGDHRRALGFSQQALALLEELGDRYGAAMAWSNSGYAHLHLGAYAEAERSYQRALELFRAIGQRAQEAGVLRRLGDVHRAAGRPRQAEVAWRAALAILEDFDPADAAEVRGKLAQAAPASSHPDPQDR